MNCGCKVIQDTTTIGPWHDQIVYCQRHQDKGIKLNVGSIEPRDFSNGNPGYDVCFGKEAWAVEVALKRDLVEALKRCISALVANGAPNCEAVKEAKALITRAEATLP